MSFDSLPMWMVVLATIALVLVSLEAGIRLGRWHTRKGGAAFQVSGAMSGATMGLLAFMLAFTFNGASVRHEARKALVVEEANAIDTTWLRAGFLAEQARATVRGSLRDYVDMRLKAAVGEVALAEAMHVSEDLQERMWAIALEAGRGEPAAITVGLFTQSLNEVIDLHSKRVTAAVRDRIPSTIWATLYLLMVIGMVMMGLQIGQSGTRQLSTEVALALAFSMALFVIADLDRPQAGLVNVSQAALLDVQKKMHAQ